MSVEAMRWARAVRGISGTQKLVLAMLADRANDAGECWPSIPGLAADCCISERAARNAMRELEAMGLVFTFPGGGRHRASLYRLAIRENPAPGSETRHEMPGMRDDTRHDVPGIEAETRHVVPERGHDVPKRGHDVPPNHQEPSGTGESGEARTARGTRLPADWQPGREDRDFAESLGLDVTSTADRFRDFWTAKAGRDAFKRDWSATWRNWCRGDAERLTRRGGAERGASRFGDQAAELFRSLSDPAALARRHAADAGWTP